MKRKIFSILFALVLVLTLGLVTAVPAGAGVLATIEVSQPTYLTSNGEYDRNPSIINDGSDYWLFYNKGDDTSTSGVRGGSYDADADTYVVYYKTAATIAGLAGAAETKLGLSESARPANFDQRVVSATYFAGNIYAFVSSGQSGTDRGLYYYVLDGSWSGPWTLIEDTGGPNRGGHVNVTSDANFVYIVWESSSDASSDAYTWDGTTLSDNFNISTDNQPKITLMGTTLYVVSIEDGTGDIEVYSAAAGASPSFSSHSRAIPGVGLYDPCIFNDGIDLYVVTAPYNVGNDQQWLIQAKYSGSWAIDKRVNYGGYGTTYWWDYWPIGYHDGTDAYVFFTTETSSPTYSDGEIAYFKMDWNLGNDHYFYIKNAVDQATPGDTINVAEGTYNEVGQIVIDKDLTIVGADRVTTIIKPTGNTTNSGDARGWFLVNTGIEFHLSNFTLDGAGYLIYQAIRHKGFGSIENVDFKEIRYNESGPDYAGLAVAAFGTGPVDISNCTFLGIGRVGVLYFALGGVSTFSGNVYTGKGDGDWLDYALDISADADVDVIGGNTISDCRGVASVDGSTSAGILVTTYYGAGTQATITSNDIYNNTEGIAVGYDESDTSVVVAHYNNIEGNTDYGIGSTAPSVDALYNYWGDETGPDHATLNPSAQGNAVSDKVDFSPWLYETQENFVSDAPCYAGSVVLDSIATPVDTTSYAGGWNSFSTPVTLDGSADYISELLALTAGSDLSIVRAQRFDFASQEWVALVMGGELTGDDYQIKPGEGFFIQVSTKGSLPILCSTTATSPPMTNLVAGWNLVGLSNLTEMTVANALNNVDYSVLLSASPPNVATWSVPPGPVSTNMELGEAYWLAMGQPGILFGHTTTPVADDLTWELNQ